MAAKLRTFLSHSSRDAQEVIDIARLLAHDLDTWFYEEFQRADESFEATIRREARACGAMVIFVGRAGRLTEWQRWEVREALSHPAKNERQFVIVQLTSHGRVEQVTQTFKELEKYPKIRLPEDPENPPSSLWFAEAILHLLSGRRLTTGSGLPADPHLFDYEKTIIEFYARKAELERDLGNQLFSDGPLDAETDAARRHVFDKLRNGAPPQWPSVRQISAFDPDCNRSRNRLPKEERGDSRPPDAMVSAMALTSDAEHTSDEEHLVAHRFTLPEAGPRDFLVYPVGAEELRVAILVLGGIAPGINAVIDGIVQRHFQYQRAHGHRLVIHGVPNGLYGLLKVLPESYLKLVPTAGNGNLSSTSTSANLGGSMLGTYRLDDLLEVEQQPKLLNDLYHAIARYDIVYIIGGDGGMKAAHALSLKAQRAFLEERKNAPNIMRRRRPVSVVAIPKTMDNDILWVWQSFGFPSAVERARQVIEELHTEVASNPRLCVLQLFGSDSGFVVSHAVLASTAGHCDLALIPEVPFTMERIASFLFERMKERGEKLPRALIVMAENAIPLDATTYMRMAQLEEHEQKAIQAFDFRRRAGRRLEGQTSDALRSAGLKVVSRVLPKLLENKGIQLDETEPGGAVSWKSLRVFTNEPRHLLRAIPPTTTDIITAQRLGTLAVDNAMAGYTDFMISQWLTEFVLVPLDLVVLGRKRIPPNGIFWRSVRSKTNQPPDLSEVGEQTRNTQPIGGQRPHIGGLRRPVEEFQKDDYFENYVQGVLNALGPCSPIVLGSDGRYWSQEAIQRAIRIAVANSYERVVVGKNGLLPTPLVSLAIGRLREEGANCFGLSFTAGHNPGGEGGDFGVRVHGSQGATEDRAYADAIERETSNLRRYRTTNSLDVDLESIGDQSIGGATVTVSDWINDYISHLQQILDFHGLRELLGRPGFAVRIDAMHGAAGPAARKVFEERLKAEPGTVVNHEPMPDFGGGAPDPSRRTGRLRELMATPHAPDFAAAIDGDGGRCSILGRGLEVHPCDSLAILSDNARLIQCGDVKAFARSFPTSRAVDAVARAKGAEVAIVPTGWGFIAQKLAAKEVAIGGEESCGVGCYHNPEKDALWMILTWLVLLAHKGRSLEEIVHEHWSRYGRHFFQRHDYVDVRPERTSALFENLLERLPTLEGKGFGGLEVSACGQFRYRTTFGDAPPVDLTHLGVEIFFGEDSRAVLRLSQTATRNHTLRLYLERFEDDESKHRQDPDHALRPVATAASELAQLSTYLGDMQPSVT